MYKPTKKTLYILIACVLSLILVVVAKNQTTKNNAPLSLNTSTGTSSENTNDTNLDYTPGQSETSTSTQIDPNENITENFSKGLMAKYMSTNNGDSLSTIDTQDLVNQAVSEYNSIDLGNTPHYAFSDLKIVRTNEQNIRNFANTFANVESECLANVRRVATTTEDPIKSGQLYEKCAEEFVKIPIVQEMNSSYLNLINAYYLIGEKTILLKDGDRDPLKALAIIKVMGPINDIKVSAYQDISTFIIGSGIIFSNTEPGRAWVGKTL